MPAMWVLDFFGVLLLIGFFFAVKNLIVSLWRDSAIVDKWARSSVERRRR
jgi:hypothetical protein